MSEGKYDLWGNQAIDVEGDPINSYKTLYEKLNEYEHLETDTTTNLKTTFEYTNDKGYEFEVRASCDYLDGYYAHNLQLEIFNEGKKLYAIHRKALSEIQELVLENFYAQAYEGETS